MVASRAHRSTVTTHRAVTDRGRRYGLVLFTVAVLVRLAVVALYDGPTLRNDSATFIGMSGHLYSLGPSNYVGLRPPGYPFILWVLGHNLVAVWALQAVLGVAACLLVYWTVLTLTQRPLAALLTGLFMTLNLDVLFYETNILTESTMLFLLTLSIAVFVRLLRSPHPLRWGLALGVLTGLEALTRPEAALLLVIWPILWLLARRSVEPNLPRLAAAIVAIAIAVPAAACVAGWSAVNEHLVGEFTPSTLTGYNLIDHLGASVAQAPDRYAVLRDAYVEDRKASIASGQGTEDVAVRNTAQLERITGKGYVALSREMTSLSLAVIEHHPTDYLELTAERWPHSWNPLIPELRSNFRSGWAYHLVDGLGYVNRHVRNLYYVGFFVLCIGALTRRYRRRAGLDRTISMAMMAMVLVMSVPEALLANGENDRYIFPYLPFVVVGFTLAADIWLRLRAERRSAATSAPVPDPPDRPQPVGGVPGATA